MKKIKRDVVSSMIESLDPSDSKSAIAKETLEGLRASSIKGGSSHLTTSLKNPGVVLDKKLDQLQSTRGGDPAIENSRVKLQDELEAPVVENRQLVGKAKDDVATAQRGIDAEISSNPGFKSITDRYGNPNQVDIDYSKTKENIRNEITQGVEEEAGRITTRKNQLYEDLPDGIEPNQQMIDSSLSEIPLPSNLVEKFDQVRGDYKKLRTFATNDLEKEIQNYRGAGKWGEADELRRLQRSLVDDQLDYVAKAARASDGKFRARHPEMAEKVETANTYMKETAGPLLRDNEPVSEIIDNRRYKGKDTATQRNRTIIESTINDRDRNIDIEKIGTLLGNDRKKLADYHKADVARIIKQRFIDRNGKLSPEDITALQGEFDKRIPGLTTGDPNSVKELNEFFTLIKDKNFNKESAMKILTDLETKGKEIEESVYDGALRDYFAKVGGQQVRNERGFDIAKRVIDSEPRSLDAALKSGDETVRKGYEVSWAKAVKERMKESDIPKLLTENFKEAGNKIFKNPLISEAIDSIAFEAQKGLGANKTRMTQGIDHGAPQERARLAVNNLITWTFGVLNPTAAKIRTVSGDYLKKNDSWDMAKQAADVVLADTDLFIKIAQEMIDKKAKQLTPEQKQLMFRVITKAGYNVKKQDRESKIKEQTEQIQK